MARASQWCFEPFRLDWTNACLWRDGEMIALPPKPLAVLTYLVQHAGQLVLKETLLDAVWPETAVGDAVLKTCMSQIRKALGETAQSPQFVATVHRKGYRFIAPATLVDQALPILATDVPGSALPVTDPPRSHPTTRLPDLLVEREAVFDYLHAKLAQARQGERQVVFVSGEAGIGKTAVIEAFMVQVTTDRQLRCVSGQCVEHHGMGEAYLPVLEALGRLCRGPDGDRVIAVIRRHAPTWLVQMPWLLDPSDRQLMQYELLGMTRERMLRELAQALDTLSSECPLVLVLEDLHWSDYATLDVITMLAQRQESARLLLVGTYRHVEAIVYEHPLRAVTQNLRLHDQGSEYALPLLSDSAVTAYLAARFPQHQFPATFAQVLHRRTDGNPLFLATMTASLLRQGVIGRQAGSWVLQTTIRDVASHVPEGLRSLIEQQLERLPPHAQQILEAGSAVGLEFSVAAVAAATGEALGQVEARCEQLSRQQRFLQPVGLDTWPDGTVTARYGFIHSLYQNVSYQHVGAGQRVQLHRRLLARLELAYSERTPEIAAELARHAMQGHEIDRAVHFLLQAAENATRRYAPRDAQEHLAKGLELLLTLPPSPERAQQELSYLMVLRVVLGATKGFRAPEMTPLLSRIAALYPQVEDLSPFAMGFWMGIWTWHLQHIESLQTAQEVAERYLSFAQHQHNQIHILRASQALGTSLLVRGAPALAREHLERAIAMYDPHQHNPKILDTTQDPGVTNLCFTAEMLWLLGYPEEALQRCQEGLTLAQQIQHPFSLAFAFGHLARLHLHRGEYRQMQARAEALITLATEQDFRPLVYLGASLRGQALVFQGKVDAGISQMRQALMANRPTSPWTFRARTLAELADAYLRVGHTSAGLDCTRDALTMVSQADGHYYEAELYRLQGELLLQQTPPAEPQAESCLRRALDIARRQRANAWALRAAVGLGRLRQRQEKLCAAYQVVVEVYDGFTEGFDTSDLRTAKAFLEELSG